MGRTELALSTGKWNPMRKIPGGQKGKKKVRGGKFTGWTEGLVSVQGEGKKV